jgi:hypothetical protein
MQAAGDSGGFDFHFDAGGKSAYSFAVSLDRKEIASATSNWSGGHRRTVLAQRILLDLAGRCYGDRLHGL